MTTPGPEGPGVRSVAAYEADGDARPLSLGLVRPLSLGLVSPLSLGLVRPLSLGLVRPPPVELPAPLELPDPFDGPHAARIVASAATRMSKDFRI
jgi:hypothetical protein